MSSKASALKASDLAGRLRIGLYDSPLLSLPCFGGIIGICRNRGMEGERLMGGNVSIMVMCEEDKKIRR